MRNFNKISRKQDVDDGGTTSIRICTERKYTKWRIEREIEAWDIPGKDKVVRIISRRDKALSQGYKTDSNNSISSCDSEN